MDAKMLHSFRLTFFLMVVLVVTNSSSFGQNLEKCCSCDSPKELAQERKSENQMMEGYKSETVKRHETLKLGELFAFIEGMVQYLGPKSVSKRQAVTGQWSVWGLWSECSKSCGGGKQTRNRTCSQQPCPGLTKEDRPCNTAVCTPSVWSQWETWSKCDLTGEQTRKRTCTKGSCVGGNARESQKCKLTTTTPVTTGTPRHWTTWSAWSTCSKSCGRGEQFRNRTCAGNTGVICPGLTRTTQRCNTQACPPPPQWSKWTEAIHCSTTCGFGVRRRTRTCVGGQHCLGTAEEMVNCNNKLC